MTTPPRIIKIEVMNKGYVTEVYVDGKLSYVTDKHRHIEAENLRRLSAMFKLNNFDYEVQVVEER